MYDNSRDTNKPASNLAELISDTIAATTGADAEVPETMILSYIVWILSL